MSAFVGPFGSRANVHHKRRARRFDGKVRGKVRAFATAAHDAREPRWHPRHPTSRFVDEQVEALRRLAPDETIVTDAGAVDPGRRRSDPRVQDAARRRRALSGACASSPARVQASTRCSPPATCPAACRSRDRATSCRRRAWRSTSRSWCCAGIASCRVYEAQQRETALGASSVAAGSAMDGRPDGLRRHRPCRRACARTRCSFRSARGRARRTTVPASQRSPGPDALDAFLAGTRVLVCLLPLTRRHARLAERSLFAKLLPSAYLINVSRGPTPRRSRPDRGARRGPSCRRGARRALARTAAGGECAWRHEKLVVTPHIAAMPRPEVMAAQLLDNLARARRGEPLRHLIDRERGY